MITLKITHDGKEYETLESAMNDAIVSGVVSMVKNKIKELQKEIDNSGGHIRIDFTGNEYDANIVLVDIPSALSDKIKSALS